MKAKYLIKYTQLDTSTGNVEVYYYGKDGYVHDDMKYVEPYNLRESAENRILRDCDCQLRRPLNLINGQYTCIESERYIIHYDIIEKE